MAKQETVVIAVQENDQCNTHTATVSEKEALLVDKGLSKPDRGGANNTGFRSDRKKESMISVVSAKVSEIYT